MTKRLIVPVIAGLCLLQSCSDNSQPDFYNGTGLLDISLEVAPPQLPGITVPGVSDFSIELTPDASPENSARWESFADFTQSTRFLAGSYTVTAMSGNLYDEDFDEPCFGCTEKIVVAEGSTTQVNLIASLLNVPVTVTATEALSTAFPGWVLTVHAAGGGYLEFVESETRTAFIRPGSISVSLSPGIGNARFLLTRDIAGKAGQPVNLILDALNQTAILSCGAETVSTLAITPELLAVAAPTVTLFGSTESQQISLAERTTPAEPAIFHIDAPTTLAEAILTIDSEILAAEGAPAQIDLVNPDNAAKTYLENNGVILNPASPGNIDISPLLAKLQYHAGSRNISKFSLEVTDEAGRQSVPLILTVTTLPVDIEVLSVSDAIIGINTIDVIIATSSPDFASQLTVEASMPDGSVESLKFFNNEKLEDGKYRTTIEIPEGNTPLTLMAYYGSELKAQFTVNRVSPDFSIEIDPFATKLRLRVSSRSFASLLPMITRNLQITVNGEPATVMNRDEHSAEITVIGLTPASSYTLSATLQPDNASAARTASFTTEQTATLPNGDFEDVKRTIKWKEMDAGGRYSQTLAEIINCQNKASFDHDTPTGWANTNPKTFYTGSKIANTWYMQPSVVTTSDAVTGDYGVELVSTAFNYNGRPIPDYLQESVPYTRYSRNIPELPFRAAAKIFLGSYSFNPFSGEAEVYNEGISFKSRPESLNGSYSYSPSPANPMEKGLVTVEVLGIVNGAETVIASGRAELPLSTGYATFSVPLTYPYFGVKATQVKVMCATSTAIGSINYESANVAVMPDPVNSRALGSRMKLDNLTFAY